MAIYEPVGLRGVWSQCPYDSYESSVINEWSVDVVGWQLNMMSYKHIIIAPVNVIWAQGQHRFELPLHPVAKKKKHASASKLTINFL